MPAGDQSPHDLAKNAPVAQLDRASDYESEGRTFESFRARHFANLRQSTLRCPILRFSRNELLPRKGRHLADRAILAVRCRPHAAFWNLMSGRNPARPASRTSMLRLNRLIFPFLIS